MHSALPQVRPEPRRRLPHLQAGSMRASHAACASSSAVPSSPGTETTGLSRPPGRASHSRGLSKAGLPGLKPWRSLGWSGTSPAPFPGGTHSADPLRTQSRNDPAACGHPAALLPAHASASAPNPAAPRSLTPRPAGLTVTGKRQERPDISRPYPAVGHDCRRAQHTCSFSQCTAQRRRERPAGCQGRAHQPRSAMASRY